MLVVAVVLSILAVDLSRAPDRQLSARALVLGVEVYQSLGHRLFPRGQCRLSPTCSGYAEAVIREHGALRGGLLTLRRVLRCGPWTPTGTKDPPPIGERG